VFVFALRTAHRRDIGGHIWADRFEGTIGNVFDLQDGFTESVVAAIEPKLQHGHAGQMTLEEVTGGSPYGATTIAGGDGSRQPTANELQGARYQGRKIAETAQKLHG